jgi:hypothetical protein
MQLDTHNNEDIVAQALHFLFHMDAHIITEMTAIIALARTTPGAELEIRFGHVHNGKFIVGCSADSFHRIHSKLDANHSVQRTPWTKTRACTYPSNLRVVHTDGKPAIVITKQCIKHMIIQPHGYNQIAFKLSLSAELPCEDNNQPTTPPIFIRFRDRQQFFHGTGDRLTWAYDFTRTHGAKTDILARQAQTIFEIELEIIDATYIQEVDPRRIARSMLHRATQLVGPVQDQTEPHRSSIQRPFSRPPPFAMSNEMPTAQLIQPEAEQQPVDEHDTDDKQTNIADADQEGTQCLQSSPPRSPTPSNGANEDPRDDTVTDDKENDPIQCPNTQELEDEQVPTEQKRNATKKTKRQAPRGAPKRPATSFMLFMADNRVDINMSLTAAGTPVNLRETSKAGSIMWRNLSPEEKEPFIARASELHSDWVVCKAVYAATKCEHQEDAILEKKKPKIARNPDEPRRPGSPFVLFMNENRASIKECLAESGTSSVTDVGRRGGVLWSELTPEGRAVFTEKFNVRNAAYKIAMAAFAESVRNNE